MKKLNDPKNQIQEVLFELINRLNINNKTMLLSCNIMSLTKNISLLRAKGIKIKTNSSTALNKYNRKIRVTNYSLADKKAKKEAIAIYKKMQDCQQKILFNDS